MQLHQCIQNKQLQQCIKCFKLQKCKQKLSITIVQKKRCLLQVVHTKAIAALTQFCDFYLLTFILTITFVSLIDILNDQFLQQWHICCFSLIFEAQPFSFLVYGISLRHRKVDRLSELTEITFILFPWSHFDRNEQFAVWDE